MEIFFNVLSNIAGCLGFLLSLYLAFRAWMSGRTKFDLTVLDYNNRYESVRFFLMVKNNSSSPLVISSISAFGTTCELEPKKIRGDPTAWNGVVSARFPVRVRAHDIEMFYIELLTRRSIPLSCGTRVSFQIETNARTVRKTVLLGNMARYLNKTE